MARRAFRLFLWNHFHSQILKWKLILILHCMIMTFPSFLWLLVFVGAAVTFFVSLTLVLQSLLVLGECNVREVKCYH